MISRLKPYILEATLVILVLIAYLGGMGHIELRAEEPRRALVAMEMAETGDYIVPRTYQMPYLNKPPFHNWCIAGLNKAFSGYEEWMVRLPGVLAFLLSAILVYLLLIRAGWTEYAFPGAMIFLCFGDILYYGSVNAGEIDPLYSLLIFIQTLGVYMVAFEKQYLKGYLLAYLFCALAVLTKSLPAVAFLGLTLVPVLLIERKWRLLLRWEHFLGILVFGVIVGGYYYMYAQRADLEVLLINIFQQGQDKNTVVQEKYSVIRQVMEYPWLFIRIGLPWTLGLLLLFGRKLRRDLWSAPLARFLIVFLLANIWIYWFVLANKIRYSYPFFPPLAALLALVIAFTPNLKRNMRLIYLVIAVMLVARIGLNHLVLPKMQSGELSESYIYRSVAEDLVDITAGEPITYTAKKEYYKGSLPWDRDRKIEWERPGVFPYQVPFYVNRLNGHLMTWADDIESSGFYLAPVEYLEAQEVQYQELYRFYDRWSGRDVVLFNAASIQE